MAGPNTAISFVDGTLDFSGGVHSLKLRTARSDRTPNGLARNELAWLINGRLRDGGIEPRAGWQPSGVMTDGSARHQGGHMYQPASGRPYLIQSIGGRIIKVQIDPTFLVTDLSAVFGLVNPSEPDQAFFEQAEEFLIIQAGDGTTLPLIYDGTTMWRSLGITNTAVAPGTPGVNEIPAATAMHYFMGRLWYAQGRTYSAGDIRGGPSGTAAYGFRDAVLNVTENPLVLGGDGFKVPSGAGDIRALASAAAIDTALGQGRLYIFTRKAVFSLQVPVTRADWIASDSQNQPLQTVIQQVNGAVNDRSIVSVNGDLYFRSLEPGIRSLTLALRNFDQPGNVDLSADVRRLLQYEDRAMLRFASGIEFDNRLLMLALPKETPQGVVFQAIVPLDFMPVSTVSQRRAPIFEGMYEGLDILQLFKGDFGGLERAFAVIVSRLDGTIQLWELTYADRREAGDNRVTMIAEFPAFHGEQEAMLKRLIGGEIWVDRLWGTVYFKLEYRPDGENCWLPWHQWQICSPRNSLELVPPPEDNGYPIDPEQFGQGYSQPISLPKPPAVCQAQMARPSDIGYQFQIRLTMRGNARLRGLLLHMTPLERKLYDNLAPCAFAEFPNTAVEVWHDYDQPGATVVQDPVIEEEEMPLEHAIYDATRDVIWGVFKGRLYKFNADTGDLEETLQLNPFYAAGGGSTIALASSDKLYISRWRSAWAGTASFPNAEGFPNNDKGFYIVDPVTMALDSLLEWDTVVGGGVEATRYVNGPDKILAVGDFIVGLHRRGGAANANVVLFRFDINNPAGTFLEGPNTAPNVPWSDLAHNPNSFIPDIPDPAINFSPSGLFFQTDSDNGSVEIISIDTGVNGWFSIQPGQPASVFGVVCPPGFDKFYIVTKTQLIQRYTLTEADSATPGPVNRVEIDTGIDMAPIRIRYNPYNQKCYIPDQKFHKVIVFNPATELVESEIDDFKFPEDFVFTPTKVFCVQLGGKALKEVV